MCEYCSKKATNTKIRCIDNHKNESIEIVLLNPPMLKVKLNAIDSDGYKAEDYFTINYCPMCGKKL